MKRIRTMIVVLSCFLLGCGHENVNYETQTNKEEIVTSMQLHVEENHLEDENGNVVQLKGISTHGIGWLGQYVNEECFQTLKEEWNVNVIRLAMYTDENNGYCTNGDKEALKQLVKNGIEYASKNNMYVIVDWHVLHDLDPNKYKKEAIQFFDEISKEYSQNTNILYEICNEPNGYTSWQDIQKYASDLIPVIRKNAPNAIIIVGTPNWSQMVDQAAANPIQEENVMYALHFYAATHKEDLRNKMVQAIQNGLPIFVSEFGICDASGNGSIDEQQANEWIQVMNQYDVSYVAWNLSNKDETSALLNKSCTKTSAFTIDDLSESGRWLYSTLTNTQVEQIPKETFVSNEIEYEYSLKNSWETNGTMYYQYELILSSHQNVDTWTIEIPFEDEFELSESWNGIYRVDGKNLIISNESYNGHIDETSKVKDVGFIATNKIKLHE